MGKSLSSLQWTLRKAAQASLLCVPLLCAASDREDAPVPPTDAPVADISELGKAAAVPSAPLAAEQLAVFKALEGERAQAEPAAPAKVENNAVVAALADGVTTRLALAAGGLEGNAVVAGLPLGLVALTGAKVLVVKLADQLPETEKRTVIKSTSAAWSGAALNNVLVALAVPPPFPIIVGLITGIIAWHHTAGQYENQDRLAALALEKKERLAALNKETPAPAVPAPVQANPELAQAAVGAAAN